MIIIDTQFKQMQNKHQAAHLPSRDNPRPAPEDFDPPTAPRADFLLDLEGPPEDEDLDAELFPEPVREPRREPESSPEVEPSSRAATSSSLLSPTTREHNGSASGKSSMRPSFSALPTSLPNNLNRPKIATQASRFLGSSGEGNSPSGPTSIYLGVASPMEAEEDGRAEPAELGPVPDAEPEPEPDEEPTPDPPDPCEPAGPSVPSATFRVLAVLPSPSSALASVLASEDADFAAAVELFFFLASDADEGRFVLFVPPLSLVVAFEVSVGVPVEVSVGVTVEFSVGFAAEVSVDVAVGAGVVPGDDVVDEGGRAGFVVLLPAVAEGGCFWEGGGSAIASPRQRPRPLRSNSRQTRL